MASGGEEVNDTILSDIEEDDIIPMDTKSPVPENISIHKFKQLLSQLDREKQARKNTEKANSELQVSFNRLKVLTHEAIKKRDEAFKKVESLSLELTETVKSRGECVADMKHELVDVLRVKEISRSEVEAAASMLVTGIDRVSNKVKVYKNFGEGGLPRSERYKTGLLAVAYGVVTRMDEVVEELVGVIERANKARDEARGVVEQRNYEFATEVLKLGGMIGSLEKGVEERDGRIEELERGREDEVMKLRRYVGEYESRASILEAKMEVQRGLVIDQLGFVGKIHQEMHNVIKVVDPSKSSEMSESLFVAQDTDVEENIRASLSGLESIYELSRFIAETTRDMGNENKSEVKLLNESVARLVKEKEQVGSLLRTAMLGRMSVDLSSKTNELFKVAENGFREAGIDYKFGNYINKDRNRHSGGVASTTDPEDYEVYALAGALENIIKQSQLEIINLKHTVDELREESRLRKEQLETQEKELRQCKLRVEELEERERVANENVDGLMLDIASAEEEILRWKVAAQEEAAAGKAVEEEYTKQLAVARLELQEANQAVIQCEKKLKFKEETAIAAMAARDAAEKSLMLADMRSTRLREKVEGLTHQLQESSGKTSRTIFTRPRYMCWPWEWLGLDFLGSHKQPESQQESANEMELSAPLL